jgi:Bacteriocin-protection, YdeI or OmpD-Associated
LGNDKIDPCPNKIYAYILYFSGAKQSKTRESRVEKYIEQILNGKGLNDKLLNILTIIELKIKSISLIRNAFYYEEYNIINNKNKTNFNNILL